MPAVSPVRRVEERWGTIVAIDVRDMVESSVLDDCFAWFTRVDDLFSTWRPDTEIMRIARGELAAHDASREVRDVLTACEQLRIDTAGAFDISFGARAVATTTTQPLVPLDPSGYVKGWAVARAACMLRDAGAACFSIDAGGDVFAAGRPAGAKWRVGIRHPWQRDRVAAVLEVADLAVATSGRYERGDHVFDPRSGLPSTDPVAVTVVGPDLALADAYATAAMALGVDDGMRWISSRHEYEALAITSDRTLITTAGIDRHRVS